MATAKYNVSKSLYEALWDRQKGLCFHCGFQMYPKISGTTKRTVTKEHVFPRSKYPNRVGSIVLACHKCNSTRGSAEPSLVEFCRYWVVKNSLIKTNTGYRVRGNL